MKGSVFSWSNKRFARLLSLMLVILMFCSLVPVGALAADDTEPVTEESAAFDEAGAASDPALAEPVQEEPAPAPEEPAAEEPEAPAAPEEDPEDDLPPDAGETPVGDNIVPMEEGEVPEAEEPEEEPVSESAQSAAESYCPPLHFEAKCNGVTVIVDAPEGTLPYGTGMRVAPVRDQAVLQTIGDELGADASRVTAVDISFLYEEAEIEPDGYIFVTLKSEVIEASSDAQVVHMDNYGATQVVEQYANYAPDEVSFVADSFSIYAVVDAGEEEEVPRIFYNFIIKNGTTGAETTVNTQIVKNGDVLYDPGFPGFEKYGYNPAESEFLGWYYEEGGAEQGPIVFGGSVDTTGMTADKTINAYAKIRTTYYVTFKGRDGEIIQVKKFAVTTGETQNVDASGVSYTPSSEYVCVGWSTVADEEARNAGNPQITETQSAPVTGNATYYPVLKQANWIHFYENDGGTGGGASYTGPIYVELGQDLSGKKPADPTRAGFDFGGWYYDEACTQAFTWSGKLEEDTHVQDHDLHLFAKWTATPTTPYTIAYWKQNANDDGYTLAEVETVQYQYAGTQTNVAGRSGIAGKYSSEHYSLSTDKPIVEQTISNKGTTTVNVYYDLDVYTMKFFFARTYSAGGRTYVQINNNNDGFKNNSNLGTGLTAATAHGSNYNDYERVGGNQNTWKDVGSIDPSSILSGAFLANAKQILGDENATIEQADYTGNTTVWGNAQTSGTPANGSMTYYYLQLKVKHGQSLAGLWPDAGNFADQTISYYNYDDRDEKNNNRHVRGDPIYPLFWGALGRGSNVAAINKADENMLTNVSGKEADYLLYWRFQSTYKALYRVYFSALADDTGTTAHGGTQYKEMTDLEFLVASGYPTFSDFQETAFNGVKRKAVESSNTGGTYDGTAYTRTYSVYYDRIRWNIIFHTNVDAGDTVTGTSGTAYTTDQTIWQVQFGEKLATYGNVRSTAETYVVDQTTRTANDGTVYLFKGWYNNEAFSGDPVDFSDSSRTMPNQALNYYAKWEKQRAQVTLEPNGGTLINGQIASFKLDFGDTLSKSSLEKNVKRDNYTLVGWYEVKDGVMSATPYAYGKVTEDVTLRARWRRDGNINIKYVSNGMTVDGTVISGTREPTDEAGYSSDSAVVVGRAPENVPEGFQFIGWSLGGNTYYPNNSFDITEDLLDGNKITLTAVYEKLGSSHSSTATTFIKFNPNGGTGSEITVDKSEKDPSKDLRVNEAITAKTAETSHFTREGYTLVGWSFDDGENIDKIDFKPGVKIAADALIKDSRNTDANTLYAVWEKNIDITVKKSWQDNDFSAEHKPDSFTVELKANGESLSPAKTVTFTKDDSYADKLFENLPPRDANGELITYSVVESAITGWKAAYENNGVQARGDNQNPQPIKITNSPEYGNIKIEKHVAGPKESLEILQPYLQDLAFVLEGPFEDDGSTHKASYERRELKFSEFTNSGENFSGQYELKWTEPGIYYVWETNAETLLAELGYQVTVAEGVNEANKITLTLNDGADLHKGITNQYLRGDTGILKIQKQVEGHDTGKYPYSFLVKYQSAADSTAYYLSGNNEPYILVKDTASATAYSVASASAEITLNNVPVGIYTVEEQGTEEGGSAQIENYSLTVGYNPATAEIEKNGTKTVVVTNTYAPQITSVDLKKLVTGNLGDVNKEFTFTVSAKQGSTDITIDGVTGEHTLKSGDTVSFENVPIGATLIISEPETVKTQDGYTVSTEVVEGTGENVTTIAVTDTNDNAVVVAFTVPDKGATVTFTNNKEVTVDTGLSLDILPFILIVTLTLASSVAMLLHDFRRRRSGEV